MASDAEIDREKERERGILAGPDRKWLLMPRDEYVEEHSRQYWGQRRDKIVDRVQNAFLDFSLLYDHLDEEMCREIFGAPPTGRGHVGPHGHIGDVKLEGVRDALAFIIFGMVKASDTREAVFNQQGYEWTVFGELLEEAIKQVGIRHGVLIDEIEPMVFRGRSAPRIEETIKRAKAGEGLTGSEIELLQKSGQIDEERLFEAIQEAVEAPDEQ